MSAGTNENIGHHSGLKVRRLAGAYIFSLLVGGLLVLHVVSANSTRWFMHPLDASCLGLLAALATTTGGWAILAPWSPLQRILTTILLTALLVPLGLHAFGEITIFQMNASAAVLVGGSMCGWWITSRACAVELTDTDDAPNSTWQFSIRHMMLVTLVVSVLSASKQVIPPDGGQLLVCVTVSFCLVAIGVLVLFTVLTTERPLLGLLLAILVSGLLGLLPPYLFNFFTGELPPFVFWPLVYVLYASWTGLLSGIIRTTGLRLIPRGVASADSSSLNSVAE